MDFNDFYHRHQVSLFLSDNAASAQARAVHRALARGYAARIARAGGERRLAACAA